MNRLLLLGSLTRVRKIATERVQNVLSLEQVDPLSTRKGVNHSAGIYAEHVYSTILMSRCNVTTVCRLRCQIYIQSVSTQATLNPNEPLVSISPILFNDVESHTTTLPSYVVEYSMEPSGESDRAHVSPIISLPFELSVP